MKLRTSLLNQLNAQKEHNGKKKEKPTAEVFSELVESIVSDFNMTLISAVRYAMDLYNLDQRSIRHFITDELKCKLLDEREVMETMNAEA